MAVAALLSWSLDVVKLAECKWGWGGVAFPLMGVGWGAFPLITAGC